MISIAPSTEVTLGHRAYHIAVGQSGHVVAVSRKGSGSILAPDHTSCTAFHPPADASDLTISANGDMLAIAASGQVVLVPTATLRTLKRLGDSIESCQFCATGELWSTERLDENSVAIDVREAETWRVMARTELADPFGSSFFKILSHPDGAHVVIWAAAGQDGQCLFWASRHGSDIIVERFIGLDATTPPSFNQSGDRFLAVCDADELRQYQFPQGPLLKQMHWPFDDMDNQIGDAVLFVDPTRALLPSTTDRLYLVDLTKMAIADEISIRGHEPKPTSEIYPSLSEDGLCSDLAYLTPLPAGQILSVHKQIPIRPSEERGDSILTWHLPQSDASPPLG
jgi:hypothetical protein